MSEDLPENRTKDSDNSPPSDHSNDVIDDAEIVFCNNCLRQPTNDYPFNVTPVERSRLKVQQYGCKDHWGLVVYICETHCKPYLTDDNSNWATVWPSVLATFFIKLDETAHLLWAMLPHALRQEYSKTFAGEFSQVDIADSSQFADATQEMEQFKLYHVTEH